MAKRTSVNCGPASYFNNPFKSIEAKVNSSHHSCAVPLMGMPGGPAENTVHTFNGTLKIYDDTFATIKYKDAHKTVPGRAKFGMPADWVCRRARPMVESEKLLAEERFTSNSPLKLKDTLRRNARSITGRTTAGRTTIASHGDQDIKTSKKSRSRRGSVSAAGRFFRTDGSEGGMKHKGSAPAILLQN